MLDEDTVYDVMVESSSALALYHVGLSDCGDYLIAQAALVGFDYSSESTFLFICNEYKVVVSGLKVLDNYPASLYWEEEVLEFEILSIYFYKDGYDFQAQNPPRLATRAETGAENFYKDAE